MHIAQRPSPGGISIHALLAESDTLLCDIKIEKNISIHALLAESDSDMWRLVTMRLDISIHALLAESDRSADGCLRQCAGYFYPRSPCGERPQKQREGELMATISIHALLAESDARKAWKQW